MQVVALEDQTVTIEAELRLPFATAQIARIDTRGPTDAVHCGEDVFLELSLTPRAINARARYLDWAPHRYARLGAVMHVPAGHAFQFRTDGGSMASVFCQVQPARVREWFEDDLEWTDRLIEASLDVANPDVRNLLFRLGEEMRRPGFASEAMAELLIAQLALELGRHSRAVDRGPVKGGLAPWRLRLIDERLAEATAPTLAELAALCSLSGRQLARGFRASRGRSIGDYLAEKRLELAKRLLATDEDMARIVRLTGFSHEASFRDAFRRQTGVTPRQFRQEALRAPAGRGLRF